MIKRLFDIIASLVGLLISAPVFLVISCIMKISESGPVIYRDLRVGRNENLFELFKIRTMVVNAKSLGGPLTSSDDPRITKIGKVLRKYKLDEIPQLFNVLRGDMSLVGPRAQKPYFYQFYDEAEKGAVLSVRPGITDYASLKFHDEDEILAGAQDPIEFYKNTIAKEKIRLQLEYVNNANFGEDLKIILQTFLRLFSSRIVNSGENGAGLSEGIEGVKR